MSLLNTLKPVSRENHIPAQKKRETRVTGLLFNAHTAPLLAKSAAFNLPDTSGSRQLFSLLPACVLAAFHVFSGGNLPLCSVFPAQPHLPLLVPLNLSLLHLHHTARRIHPLNMECLRPTQSAQSLGWVSCQSESAQDTTEGTAFPYRASITCTGQFRTSKTYKCLFKHLNML